MVRVKARRAPSADSSSSSTSTSSAASTAPRTDICADDDAARDASAASSVAHKTHKSEQQSTQPHLVASSPANLQTTKRATSTTTPTTITTTTTREGGAAAAVTQQEVSAPRTRARRRPRKEPAESSISSLLSFPTLLPPPQPPLPGIGPAQDTAELENASHDALSSASASRRRPRSTETPPQTSNVSSSPSASVEKTALRRPAVNAHTAETAKRTRSASPNSPQQQQKHHLPSTQPAPPTDCFQVMLNHKRVDVDRRHPFLDPASLFLTAATQPATYGYRAVAGDLLTPPLHRYGSRPVLLLDYTGAVHLRHVRRRQRAAIEAKMAKVAAERKELAARIKVWSERRARADRARLKTIQRRQLELQQQQRQRQQPEQLAACAESAAVVENDSEAAPARQPMPPPDAVPNGDVGGVAASAERVVLGDDEVLANCPLTLHGKHAVFNGLCAVRDELRKKSSALRHELKVLRRMKRCPAFAKEGCVLMLPSPESPEVRLCPGHHYRTVCFVGEELMDIYPGEGPVPRTAPVASGSSNKPADERRVVEVAAEEEGKAEPNRDRTERPLSWVDAELCGYNIFCHFNQHLKQPTNEGEGEEGAPAVAEKGNSVIKKHPSHQPRLVGDPQDLTMVDAFLRLPACEAAMYREWAIQKFGQN